MSEPTNPWSEDSKYLDIINKDWYHLEENNWITALLSSEQEIQTQQEESLMILNQLKL